MSMRLRVVLLSAALIGIGNSAVHAAAINDAFNQGAAMGNASNAPIAAGLTGANAQANIPSYGASTSTQSSYFEGGNGNTAAPGAAQMGTCATAAPGADPMANQYCDAVNFLATNASTRPQITISPNDPLLVKSRAISNAPSMILQTNGINTSGTTSQCTPVTTTTPAQYTTQTCNTIQGLSTTQCVMGRVVNIATNTNYQCKQTVQGYETLSCRRGVSATVGFGQCTPGAWLGRAAYVDCPRCLDHYMAMNIFCGANGISYSVEPYRSSDGVNRFDYNTFGYPWNGSYGQFPVAVAPGQSVTDYYVSNLGFGCNLYVYFSVNCSATTCIPSMRNVSSGCNSSGGSGAGAPLQLPMSKTVSTWTSNECLTLQQRAQ